MQKAAYDHKTQDLLANFALSEVSAKKWQKIASISPSSKPAW